MSDISALSEDEKELARLGYKQELARSWSGFSNFAISFSIISILAGCFTTFGLGWNNGGPVGISWGWPIVSLFILLIGFCMAELVSAYPTSGGIYWWANKLGGVQAGYWTGWLNLIGLIAIVASVAYGCATFLDITISQFSSSWAAGYSLGRVFVMFLVILGLAAAVNIFSSKLLAALNNVSVWWHVIGASVIIAILWLVPDKHASHELVWTHVVNNNGFMTTDGDGNLLTKGAAYLFLVFPIAAILTQYTITGYDASAHLSEETQGAANNAAKGIWQSIFYSAIGGWIVLLSFLYAVQDEAEVTAAFGFLPVLLVSALGAKIAGLVLLISSIGQFFCTCACLTSTSRMLYAFSRDGAVPGSKRWSTLNPNKVPVNAIGLATTVAALLTLPALVSVNVAAPGDAPVPSPVAFFAVVSIGVVGLYLSFAIPIYYRWRHGEAFKQGPWNLGNKWKWMAPLALLEIVITSMYAMLPTSGAGNFFSSDVDWRFVNYTPLVLSFSLLAILAFWHLSAKNWYTGPKHTADEALIAAVGGE
jgi:amino acid transporter